MKSVLCSSTHSWKRPCELQCSPFHWDPVAKLLSCLNQVYIQVKDIDSLDSEPDIFHLCLSTIILWPLALGGWLSGIMSMDLHHLFLLLDIVNGEVHEQVEREKKVRLESLVSGSLPWRVTSSWLWLRMALCNLTLKDPPASLPSNPCRPWGWWQLLGSFWPWDSALWYRSALPPYVFY